jgi:hypothetical protein
MSGTIGCGPSTAKQLAQILNQVQATLWLALTGRAAASAVAGPVAAFVGHPVAGATSPVPSGWPDLLTPVRGEQSPAGSGAERADQLQVPATSGSTAQRGLLRGPAANGNPLSVVHGQRDTPVKQTLQPLSLWPTGRSPGNAGASEDFDAQTAPAGPPRGFQPHWH